MNTRSRSPEARRPLLSTASLLALCIAIAASTGLIHYQLIDLGNLQSQLLWHSRIVAGQGPYPDQYRVLTYALVQGLMALGMQFASAQALVRFAFTSASIFIFHRYLSYWVRPGSALLGVFMLAAALPLSFLFYSMQPTDPLNMLIFFSAFLAFQRERDAWMLPLVVVGTLNRETALLLPLLYLLVRWNRAPLRRWLPNVLIATATGVGIYIGERVLIGLRRPYAPTSFLTYWQLNTSDWLTWIQVLGFFNLGLWLAWKDWRSQPAFLKRAALIVPVFLIIYLSVGKIREIRYFLPVLPVMIPLTLLTLERAGTSAERTPAARGAPRS